MNTPKKSGSDLAKLGAAALLKENKDWRKRDTKTESISNAEGIFKGITIFGEYGMEHRQCAAPQCPTLSGAGDLSTVAGATIKIMAEYGTDVQDCKKVVEPMEYCKPLSDCKEKLDESNFIVIKK